MSQEFWGKGTVRYITLMKKVLKIRFLFITFFKHVFFTIFHFTISSIRNIEKSILWHLMTRHCTPILTIHIYIVISWNGHQHCYPGSFSGVVVSACLLMADKWPAENTSPATLTRLWLPTNTHQHHLFLDLSLSQNVSLFFMVAGVVRMAGSAQRVIMDVCAVM